MFLTCRSEAKDLKTIPAEVGDDTDDRNYCTVNDQPVKHVNIGY